MCLYRTYWFTSIKFSFHLIARAVKDRQKVREVLRISHTNMRSNYFKYFIISSYP
uniref:Uncharacterized protein n=1 Tax=virus sp. ctRTq15 TaxID=2828253 RepID=A0A8S5RA91_9VIRU|nr:MAG TPA: hypothetical protein [virus sp. ctRTq15]